MYTIDDITIHEPNPDIPGDKKTVCACIRVDGYEADTLRASEAPVAYGRSEVGSSRIYVTVPYTEDERKLARAIRDKIAEMKRDRTQEKLLLGKLTQLGSAALNP